MDFRQIEAFIKVVELASFSKAAEELHVSQPSISHYITTLEKELDVLLINRSTKVWSVTLAGERFLTKAKEIMSLKRESIETLQNLSDDVKGNIRLMASSVPAVYMLPAKMALFHHQYPGVTFAVSQGDTLEVVRGIAAGKADIGFTGSMLKDKNCEFYEYENERLMFIAPNNGEYSEQRAYSPEELLCNNCFIARELGSGTRIQYEKYLTENDIDPESITTCAYMDSTSGIVNAVINGLGVSIVSELAARQALELKLIIPIKLTRELPERKIYTVLNKNIVHSHITKLFIEFIKPL